MFCFTVVRLLQCSCHLGLLGRAMEVEQQDINQLETQFASMSINSASTSSSTGVTRSVIKIYFSYHMYSETLLISTNCRSWPAQGELPQCFNVDMSSSKVCSDIVLLENLQILYIVSHR